MIPAPRLLDAPEENGLWWMLAEGRAPEPVVIDGLCRVRDRVVCRVRRIGRDGSLAFDDPDLGRALRWLRLTLPEVTR